MIYKIATDISIEIESMHENNTLMLSLSSEESKNRWMYVILIVVLILISGNASGYRCPGLLVLAMMSNPVILLEAGIMPRTTAKHRTNAR